MPKCPYCEAEHNIEDFFEWDEVTTISGKLKMMRGEFNGDRILMDKPRWERRYEGKPSYPNFMMWSCPSCDKILGFSSHSHATS